MSSMFEGFLSTPEALENFSDRRLVSAMLRFEASLARAQASVGLIPDAAAQSIMDTCKVELFDVSKIVRESGRAGGVALALVSSLKETVGLFNRQAAAFVHFGSSPQDLMDTAMALVTRDALGMIESDVQKTVASLLLLAETHAATPVLARALMQPVSVTSFGLKCALWAAPLVRSLQRLQSGADLALSVQLGGPVGTLAQMTSGTGFVGTQVMALMAADLKLRAPPYAWHTQRDEWVALGCEVALLVGSLGKIAKDMSLMNQFETGEVAEALDAGQGGLPASLHKRGPLSCMGALAAAQRVPQRAAALLAAMPQEHEGALGNWQAELAEWPGLLTSAQGAARAMAQVVSGLQVDSQRMRANIDAVRHGLPRDVADEWFNPLLAQHAAALTQVQLGVQRKALAVLALPAGV